MGFPPLPHQTGTQGADAKELLEWNVANDGGRHTAAAELVLEEE